jgi:hypothetical protein
MGIKWGSVEDNYYESTSQIIASLFIAMAVELFADRQAWSEPLARVQALVLIALSWIGLFACIRALAGGGDAISVALAGAGVTAASTLVALTLYGRIGQMAHESRRHQAMADGVLVVLIVIPVLVLTIR